MTLPAGTRLGRYEILSKIGEGGMGEVYLADDTKLERKVALKILPANVAADQERMERFVREAKAAAALNHPNIAHICCVGAQVASLCSTPHRFSVRRNSGRVETPGWDASHMSAERP